MRNKVLLEKLDELIERQTRDLVYELKRLAMPVTPNTNKDLLGRYKQAVIGDALCRQYNALPTPSRVPELEKEILSRMGG